MRKDNDKKAIRKELETKIKEFEKHGTKVDRKNRIERSMLNKGNCYDNCVIECFFGNLKTEIGGLCQFKTVQKLIDKIE